MLFVSVQDCHCHFKGEFNIVNSLATTLGQGTPVAYQDLATFGMGYHVDQKGVVAFMRLL